MVPERNKFVEKERRDARAMRGIGEFLLLDERIVVQPVEQLRAVGADHLGLRIMDVGVDEAGHDERAGMIVDERAARRAGENVARLADRLDQAAGDENGAVVDERMSATSRSTAGSSVNDRMRPRMMRAFALKAGCP